MGGYGEKGMGGYRRTRIQVGGQMDGYMDGRMHACTYGWMDGWMVRWICSYGDIRALDGEIDMKTQI